MRDEKDRKNGSVRPSYLAICLIREHIAQIFNASVEEAGPQLTIESVRKYALHSGMAIANNARAQLGLKGNGLIDVAFPEFLLHSILAREGSLHPLVIRSGVAVMETEECTFLGAVPEFCIANTHAMTEGICKEVNPDYEYVWTHHIMNGDGKCRCLIKKKDAKGGPASDDVPDQTVQPFVLPEEAMRFWVGNFTTEGSMVMVKAMLDVMDPKQVSEVLMDRGRRNGSQRSVRTAEEFGLMEGSIQAVGNGLIRYGKEISQVDQVVRNEPEAMEVMVTECPFSQGPSQMCDYYESFWSGVCEGIDPALEYRCDKRMTNGEKSCHWSLTKRSAPKDDPAKILALRLAKGEISEEEFERKMGLLRRFGAVE